MSVHHLVALRPAVHMALVLQMELGRVYVLVIAYVLLELQLMQVHHISREHSSWLDHADASLDHLFSTCIECILGLMPHADLRIVPTPRRL